ncbi:MAG: hypothetical protein EA401_13810, partial [Planctomycetota bacterium]
MRTRSRMLLAFISAHVIFTLVVGLVSTLLLQGFLRAQAESSARSLAAVLTSGGFSLTPAVQERMVELTGYEFELFEQPLQQVPAVPGTVRIPFEGGVVRVEYRTPAYAAALRGVWWATVLVGLIGIAVFAIIAWWLSSHLSRPIEQ